MVVDDSAIAAIGIATVIQEGVESVAMCTPDDVAQMGANELSRFDRVIVDVWDDHAQQTEAATDILSGVDSLRGINEMAPHAVTIAIVPLLRDPLLMKRVIDIEPSAVVNAVHLNSINSIAHLATSCGANCSVHQPEPVSRASLLAQGFDGLSPNKTVQAYQASDLYGVVRPGVTKASLGRRQTTRLRDDLISAGIVGLDCARPRWPEVVDLLMRILGRKPA